MTDHNEDRYQHERDKRQTELNEQIIKPVSFEIYEKTDEEKAKLANLKAEYKQQKNN